MQHALTIASFQKTGVMILTIMQGMWGLIAPTQHNQTLQSQGYEKCLAGKNVVFIGDSRVRYQFMHLAAYLKYERFMKCRDVTITPAEADEECFVIDERMKQRNWTLWFEESTKALNRTNRVVYVTVIVHPNLIPSVPTRIDSSNDLLDMGKQI